MNEPWVWVDFENTPHVLFLSPIIEHLVEQRYNVRITARRQAQTVELAHKQGFEVSPIGSGDFRGLGLKVLGVLGRAARLTSLLVKEGRPRALVSCSRAASLAAWSLRVPAVTLLDYEHAEQRTLALASRVIWFPDVLRDVDLPSSTRRVARFYEGLKENLYLDRWPVDRQDARGELGLTEGDFLVIARPPAETAHYTRGEGMEVWLQTVSGLASRSQVRIMIVPRSEKQGARLKAQIQGFNGGIEFVGSVTTGPRLIGAADLVLGGGGTMNREAAVLGVPAWSTFTGPTPRIDQRLAEEGRLRWVRTDAELQRALQDPLPAIQSGRGPYPQGLAAIVADLDERLDSRVRGDSRR
jgi:uncharacterized protein